MARGVYEFKIHMQKQSHDGGRVDLSDPEFADIQRFLDNFYMSRIGIRMLIGWVKTKTIKQLYPVQLISLFLWTGQHLELRKNIPGYVGLICRQTNPGIVAQDAMSVFFLFIFFNLLFCSSFEITVLSSLVKFTYL